MQPPLLEAESRAGADVIETPPDDRGSICAVRMAYPLCCVMQLCGGIMWLMRSAVAHCSSLGLVAQCHKVAICTLDSSEEASRGFPS